MAWYSLLGLLANMAAHDTITFCDMNALESPVHAVRILHNH